MKKTLKSAISVFLCVALTLTILLISPLKTLAVPSPHVRVSIEGASQEVFSADVPFTRGQNVQDILQSLYTEKEIGCPQISYGFLSAIGDGTGPHDLVPTANTYLAFYINDVASSVGIDSVYPADGDNVVIALTGYDPKTYADMTDYPLVTLSPVNPTPGSVVTVTVNMLNYDGTFSAIGGAGLTLGSMTASTAADGTAQLTMPATAGSYTLQISHENPDPTAGYPLLVRRCIPVTVSGTPPQARTIGVSDTDRAVDLGTDTVSSIDVTGGGAAVIKTKSGGLIPGALSAIFRDGSDTFSVEFSAGTIITGPLSWDGKITLSHPSSGSVTITGGTVFDAAEIGSAAADLGLSTYARITLPRQSGKKAGFTDASGSFHPITTKLLSDSVPSGFSGADAYYDDGYNLIVYTKHLSEFIAYSPSAQGGDSSVKDAISGAAGYLQKNDDSDWTTFALTRAGYPAPQNYLSQAAQNLSDGSDNFGGPTGLAKTVIVLRAAGANPLSFNGMNLVDRLSDYQGLETGGLNGPIYALLAMDSGKYPAPSPSLYTDQNLVNTILAGQNPDGSFALSKGSTGDPDITAMAVTALSPHLTETGVTDAVNGALGFLQSVQTKDGGFIPSGSSKEASETISQVIIALSSAGLDPSSDGRFTNLIDALLVYKNSDGSFSHSLGAGADVIATQQALMALEAYSRFETNGPLLYDLTNISDSITTAAVTGFANPQTGSSDSVPLLYVFALTFAVLTVLILRKKQKV